MLYLSSDTGAWFEVFCPISCYWCSLARPLIFTVHFICRVVLPVWLRRLSVMKKVAFLLSLWIIVGFCERRCPQETLSLYALVPACSDAVDTLSCDYFVRGGLQLAANHLNEQSSILKNITLEITVFDEENVRHK